MKINRLFEIVYILLDKKRVTADYLAKRFEVSVRTIYRDIETLSSAGIPVYMTKGKGGGISLLPDFVFNKAVLTEGEKEEILTSLKTFNAVNLSETDSALKKLGSMLGEANTDWIEVDFSSWGNSKDERENFGLLKCAILSKKIVAFLYAGSNGIQSDRKVEPLKLCFKGGAWYLYGFCKARSDFRFFKLRRMKGLKITNETFTKNFAGQVFTGENMFHAERITIKLKVMPEMSFRVFEEFDKYEKIEDGSFIVERDFPKGEWLFYYIATFGEFCEVLEPNEVRVQIKDRLQRMIKLY